ncbi:MAG: acyl carrier protein [Lachnospiraceae bacterium]|nr:acyl carrier protein [Lachnospiraceae bacterium]
MEGKIIALIEDVLGIEKGSINRNTRIEDVEEWDSLMHVMIIGELENRLSISVPLEEAAEVESVDELMKLIEG